VASVFWGERISLTANELLNAGSQRTTLLDEACPIIRDLLGGGPRDESDVRAACEAEGVTTRTYYRARQSLGVRSMREGYGAEGRWVLHLDRLDDVAAIDADGDTDE
jgi:hypothetical protein